MSLPHESKEAELEEVDTVNQKWQISGHHVDEQEIPLEQRKAEARIM